MRILIGLFRPDFVIGQSLLAKLTGLTTICISTDCTVDLVWGHTTDSMCIGYMAEQDKKPKVRKALYLYVGRVAMVSIACSFPVPVSGKSR